MQRNLPPSEKYIESKKSVDNTYTLWGWDRRCDEAYVTALWQMGLNQKVPSIYMLMTGTGKERGGRKKV
jgi:hypothetical protein